MNYIEMVNGRAMPALGLGTWQLRGTQCRQVVKKALDLGYEHIDTAEAYGNETDIGLALKDAAIDRENIFLTTKIWTSHYEREALVGALDHSLRRLKTEYVDLLLLHWPSNDVPLMETLDAMCTVVEKQKVLAIGISNFPLIQFREACGQSRIPVACHQIEFHVLLSQENLVREAAQRSIVTTAYSPLAQGKLVRHPLLQEIGARHGKSASQVALRWLVQQPGVAVIPKASSETNLKANLGLFDFELDEDDLRILGALNGDCRVNNPPWAPQWGA